MYDDKRLGLGDGGALVRVQLSVYGGIGFERVRFADYAE